MNLPPRRRPCAAVWKASGGGDEELARLRANAAASLAAPAPPEGEQVAALSSMVQNLFVAERARNDGVHQQQAMGYERGPQRQSDLTALREAQLSKASSIGTCSTRTKVIAAQLDAAETNLSHLNRALGELSKRLVEVPVSFCVESTHDQPCFDSFLNIYVIYVSVFCAYGISCITGLQ